MQEERIVQSVRETILEAMTTANPQALGIAVSGGIDSMVLLHAAIRMAKLIHASIEVYHVNHGVRENASADAAWVLSHCEQWGVRTHLLHVNSAAVPHALRRGLEADLRELRYSAIATAAAEQHVCAVLVGHHGDDLAETMVWRLSRGTSLSGLTGIRRSVERYGMRWLRPLLSLTKDDIRHYATLHGVPFREDETNADVVFQRNLIRHQVIPVLRQINPRLTETLRRTAELMQAEDDYLESEADRLVHACSSPSRSGRRVDLSVLKTAPVPLQRRAIKILLYCLTSAGWSAVHVAHVMALASSENPSAQAEIGHGVIACRQYDVLMLSRCSRLDGFPNEGGSSASESVNWDPEETDHVVYSRQGQVTWRLDCVPWAPRAGIRSVTQDQANFPKVSSFTIRRPQVGERVRPIGMAGSKKLQDIFTDAKVPHALRKDWPLICCDGEVAWIPGVLRCRTALLTPDDQVGWTMVAKRLEPPDDLV